MLHINIIGSEKASFQSVVNFRKLDENESAIERINDFGCLSKVINP